MASFVETISDVDVRYSQPISTPVNTEVNNSVGGLLKGIGSVVEGAVDIVHDSIIDSAYSETSDRLDAFGEEVRSGTVDYNAIRDQLKTKYKGDIVNKMSNTTLRDLKVQSIRRQMIQEYGRTRTGRQTVDAVMKDRLGYASPVVQGMNELRSTEQSIAAQQATNRIAVYKELEASGLKIPKAPDGSYNAATDAYVRAYEATGANIYAIGSSLASKGGNTNPNGKNREPLAILSLSNDVGKTVMGEFTQLTQEYTQANTPEARAAASNSIYQYVTRYQDDILAGKYKNIGGSAEIFSNYNLRERSDLFSQAQEYIDTRLGSIGIADIKVMSPESVAEKLSTHRENLVNGIKNQTELNIQSTQEGRLLTVVAGWRNEGVARVFMQKLGDYTTLALTAAKNVDINAAYSVSNKTLVSISKGEVPETSGANKELVGLTSLATFSEGFRDVKPDEQTTKEWYASFKGVMESGLPDSTKANRDNIIKTFDSGVNAGFLKSLYKQDPDQAKEVFEYYAQRKVAQQKEILSNLADDMEYSKVSLDPNTKRFTYTGSQGGAEEMVADLNKSLTHLDTFTKSVSGKENGLTKYTDSLVSYFKSRHDAALVLRKESTSRSSGKAGAAEALERKKKRRRRFGLDGEVTYHEED
jgi:hypothetical protein